MNINSIDSFSYNWSDISVRSGVDLPPKGPFFNTDSPEWVTFLGFIGDLTKKNFPNGLCAALSRFLYLFLAQVYEGKLNSNQELTIQIPGYGAAAVIPRERQMLSLYKNFYTNHYFLELYFSNGETWIMDPTWKQFMHSSSSIFAPQVHFTNPYHRELKFHYPDLMIAKHADFMAFLDRLSISLSREDYQTSSQILKSKSAWSCCSKVRTREFSELFEMCTHFPLTETARNCYALQFLDLYWPVLQIAANKPCTSLQKFCQDFLNNSK